MPENDALGNIVDALGTLGGTRAALGGNAHVAAAATARDAVGGARVCSTRLGVGTLGGAGGSGKATGGVFGGDLRGSGRGSFNGFFHFHMRVKIPAPAGYDNTYY